MMCPIFFMIELNYNFSETAAREIDRFYVLSSVFEDAERNCARALQEGRGAFLCTAACKFNHGNNPFSNVRTTVNGRRVYYSFIINEIRKNVKG